MKRFILGFVLAISIPAFAAVLWPSGVYLETFQNGFKFGTGKILSVLNDAITFDGKRLDDADKDIFFQEDFEGAAVSFTCDANIAADNETDTPLMGSDTSKSFTQSTGAQDEVCSSANIPFAGDQEAKLCLVSSGSTNFDLKVYDVTNSTYLGTAPLRGNSNQDCVWFEGKSSTANIRYDLVVRIEENADELIIDNVQAKYFPFETGDIYASSKWESFTPTVSSSFNGISSSFGKWRRVGDSMEIEASFVVTGSPSGSVAYIDLPNGHEIDSTKISSSSQNTLGTLYRVNNTDTWGSNNGIRVLWTDGSNLDRLFVADAPASDGVMAKGNANQFATNDGIIFSARIPIAGWTNTKKSVTVKNTTSSDIASENNFDAVISSTGVVSGENYDWINGDCTESSGAYSCDINLTLSEPLICSSGKIQGANPGYDIFFNNAAGDINFVAKTTGGSAASAGPFNIRCTRRGSDFVKERDRVYTFAADSLTGNYVRAEGGSGSITADTIPIPFTEVKDTANAWDGDEYTVQKNSSVIEINGTAIFTSTNNRAIHLFKNDTFYKRVGAYTSSSTHSINFKSDKGEFAEGDVLELRVNNAGGDINNLTEYHYLNISEEYGDRGTFVGQWGYESCYVKDVKSSGTDGGDATSGSWLDRVLNTVKGNCDFLSLSSNRITLKKGGYEYRCEAVFNQTVNSARIRLFNVTSSTEEAISLNRRSGTGDDNIAPIIEDYLTVTSESEFDLEYRVTTSQSTNGLGASTSFGDEVYAQCKFTKVR